MPIREETFRIGCGRYTQKAGAIASLGDEVLRLGKAPLIVGGPVALSIAREKIEKALNGVCPRYEIVTHAGSCNEPRAQELAHYAKEKDFDVIVGVGGGVIMDFAKLIGDVNRLPVINVPTSSATCAAYTPLSVRYTPDGRTVGSKHYGYELAAVIADTQIIATQPPRLLLAGVFDALAKYLEIKQRFTEDTAEYPLGLDWAYYLSKHSFVDLNNRTEKSIAAIEKGEVTDDLEKLIFTSIVTTGVISGIARGSNQCALAHKFYESTRRMFFEASRTYLHGEIVGVGLLLQNHFNAELENNESLLSLMKKYHMPAGVSDIGVIPSAENLEKYFEELKNSSAIDETNEDELRRLRAGLEYLFRLD